MHLVVDSSVIVHLLVSGGPLGPLQGHRLSAPALLASEAVSALRELVFRGDMPEQSGRSAVVTLGSLPIEYEPAVGLAVDATSIASRLGWAKTYDAEYLALADRLDCPLITLDLRLLRGSSHAFDVRTPTDL